MQVRSACRGRVVDELLLSPKEGCCSVSVIVDLDSTSVASKAFVPGEEHKSVAHILVGLSNADLERRLEGWMIPPPIQPTSQSCPQPIASAVALWSEESRSRGKRKWRAEPHRWAQKPTNNHLVPKARTQPTQSASTTSLRHAHGNVVVSAPLSGGTRSSRALLGASFE